MAAELTYTNLNDLRSWYNGTVVIRKSDNRPYIVDGVFIRDEDDEEWDEDEAQDLDLDDAVLALIPYVGRGVSVHPDEVHVVYPEPFFGADGRINGSYTDRSYKRAPNTRDVSLGAFTDYLSGSEPSFNPDDEYPRIGWQYCLFTTRDYSTLRAGGIGYRATRHRTPPLTCVHHVTCGFVGFYEDGKIHVINRVHFDRMRDIIQRTGGDTDVLVLINR